MFNTEKMKANESQSALNLNELHELYESVCAMLFSN